MAQAREKGAHRAWKRALLVLLALFLALAGAEAWLRATLEPVGATLIAADCYRLADNPEIGYQLAAGACGANSDGLRDREHTVDKPPGVFRILALGDSLAYGLGVGGDRTWPRELERALNRGSRDGETYEVINLGVPGYGTGQIVERFKEKGLKYRPDLVVYGYWLDDVTVSCNRLQGSLYEASRNRRIFSESPLARWMVRQALRLQIARRSLLLIRKLENRSERKKLENAPAPRLMERLGAGTLAAWRDFSEQYAQGRLRDPWFAEPYFEPYTNLLSFSRWNACLKELSRICRDQGIPCVLFLTPVLVDRADPQEYPWLDLNDFIGKIAGFHGIPTLDTTPAFSGLPARLASIGDQEHPSELGHAVIARELARYLKENGLLEKSTAP